MKKIALSLTIAGLLLTAAPPNALAVRASGVALSAKQTDHCSALAPKDWTVSSNEQGSTLDATSGDHTMYAGWGVVQINRAMQNFYGPMYGDPQTSIQTLGSTVLRAMFGDSSGLRYTSAPQQFLKFFALQSFVSATAHGTVFYHIYPVDRSNYIESVYFAITSNTVPRSRGFIAQGVAVSIRCQTQLVYHAPATGRDPGGSASTKGCGGEGNLRGYNKELGWQYAHTSGGTNKLFDIGDWRENGPQGAGYYATVGNSLEKLELGRSDDC